MQPVPQSPHHDGRRYYRCRRCHSISLFPLPRHEENLFFEDEATAAEMASIDEGRTAMLQRRLRLAGGPPRPGARLLDIGCATGRLLALARKAAWDVVGIDLSAALIARAESAVPGAPLYCADFMAMDVLELGRFDAILALDVLEHVLAPREFLDRAASLLNPGGRLVIQTPNADSLRARLHRGSWNMLIPEYHFHLVSLAGLQCLLNDAGFGSMVITTASGSGLETGWRAVLASATERALAATKSGNALLASCTRLPSPATG